MTKPQLACTATSHAPGASVGILASPDAAYLTGRNIQVDGGID